MTVLPTLRARLAAATAASILAAVAVFALVTVLVVGHELRGSLDGALRTRAQDVAQLAVSAPAVLRDPGALESPSSGRQLTVEVVDARGRILARSLALGALLLPRDALVRAALAHGRAGVQDIRLAGRTFRMFVAPVAQATGPASGGAVLVAADTTDIGRTLSSLGVVVALSGVGVVLLAALAAALLTRRGLRPLRELAGAAGEIERTADPARRLPEPAGRDEIARLTGVLNRMLSALEAARAGERRFLADASHELRTPVTSLLGNVEYAARHGADEEVLADLRHDAQRLARLVDALLAVERASAADPPDAPVEVPALVRSAVAEAQDDRVLVREPLPAATVSGDADALRRAVLNLIENGLIHGPPGGCVEVALTVSAPEVVITVTDQGPGPDPADRDHLFERFWRAPGSTERPGSGLGLPIVAATATRHGGTVTVQGSAFALHLPRRRPPSPT
ncbi:MAG TPA: HAMP domain-containing sensor histidine kinase [Solirubrobacteraceae bacterium]|nr:HAMP domain-containing sensor histidine kinase [Solirubrobacteraceae bacterium]